MFEVGSAMSVSKEEAPVLAACRKERFNQTSIDTLLHCDWINRYRKDVVYVVCVKG